MVSPPGAYNKSRNNMTRSLPESANGLQELFLMPTKSFSIASLNSSHAWVFASVATAAVAILVILAHVCCCRTTLRKPNPKGFLLQLDSFLDCWCPPAFFQIATFTIEALKMVHSNSMSPRIHESLPCHLIQLTTRWWYVGKFLVFIQLQICWYDHEVYFQSLAWGVPVSCLLMNHPMVEYGVCNGQFMVIKEVQ